MFSLKKSNYSDEEDLNCMFMDLKQNPYISEFSEVAKEIDNKKYDYYSHLNSTEEDNIFKGDGKLDMDTEQHNPTKLRISTMTAVCDINTVVKLNDLYKYISFYEDESEESGYPYIKSCQFSSEPIKGYIKNEKNKKKAKSKTKNCFQNQSTLIIALSDSRKINLKIFRNGKIQMTGLKSEEEGYIAANTLISKILNIQKEYPDFINSPNKTPVISSFSIVLINSDFSAGFRIKREKLYELLFKSGMYVSYEPDIYPGVNAKFYWNTKNCQDDGICRCSKICDGKGDGNGDGNCKKVTIATFQSGNVIITGARKNIQTKEAYNFINKIFSENIAEIKRTVNLDEDLNDESSTKSYKKRTIDIDKIINIELLEKLKSINLDD